MDLGLNLEGTHVLITGGSGFIGSVTVTALLSAACMVTSLDLRPPPQQHRECPNFHYISCDITSEAQLANAFSLAEVRFNKPVQTCIALASLGLSVLNHRGSLADMSVEQWRRTHQVNVEGTFLTAKTWLRGIRKQVQLKEAQEENNISNGITNSNQATELVRNIGFIIVGSESSRFGERGNPDYAAGKSAVQDGLLKSLAMDVCRIFPRGRVNAVAPGPVDTAEFQRECAENPDQLYLHSQATTVMGVPVPPEQVAKSILFLASESWSGNVCGQVLCVDSGKQGKLAWMRDELAGS